MPSRRGLCSSRVGGERPQPEASGEMVPPIGQEVKQGRSVVRESGVPWHCEHTSRRASYAVDRYSPSDFSGMTLLKLSREMFPCAAAVLPARRPTRVRRPLVLRLLVPAVEAASPSTSRDRAARGRSKCPRKCSTSLSASLSGGSRLLFVVPSRPSARSSEAVAKARPSALHRARVSSLQRS